jgi:hypothetical protein
MLPEFVLQAQAGFIWLETATSECYLTTPSLIAYDLRAGAGSARFKRALRGSAVKPKLVWGQIELSKVSGQHRKRYDTGCASVPGMPVCRHHDEILVS